MAWTVGQVDVSPFLWDFRRSVIEKHSNLDSDVKKLRSIQSDLVLSERETVIMARIATQFSQLSHSQASDFVLDESISRSPAVSGVWMYRFPPSEAQKKVQDPILQALGGLTITSPQVFQERGATFFIMETKKGLQEARTVQNGHGKVFVQAQVGVGPSKSAKGCAGTLFEMALVARGLYIMSVFAEVFVPRSDIDMHCLAGSIDTFQKIKASIDSYIQDIATATAESEEGQDWSMPSYSTPVRVRIGSGLAPGSSSSSSSSGGGGDQKLNSKYNMKVGGGQGRGPRQAERVV
ncbi:hypothetical protein BGZ47_006175 [Haplosporangium gracile]|nr:hypothetical protein BGZ47_006175 [Haplosporangium gracile]